MSVFIICLFLIGVLILVAISRWIFRINDIVKRLDEIVSLLKGQKGEKK